MHKPQQGSAHLVIIIILTLALVGSLGFVFWQNFVGKDSNTEANVTAETSTDKKVVVDTEESESTEVSFESKIGYSITVPKDFIVSASVDSLSVDGFRPPSVPDALGMSIYYRDPTSVSGSEQASSEGYGGVDTNRPLEKTTVGGNFAFRVTDNNALQEDYWIYDKSKTKVVRVMIAAETVTDKALYDQALKSFAWL